MRESAAAAADAAPLALAGAETALGVAKPLAGAPGAVAVSVLAADRAPPALGAPVELVALVVRRALGAAAAVPVAAFGVDATGAGVDAGIERGLGLVETLSSESVSGANDWLNESAKNLDGMGV